MKTLFVICTFALSLILLFSPVQAAGPPNLHFDFNKDGNYDTQWNLDVGEKVDLEIWIDEWDAAFFSDEDLFAVRMFFYYDDTQIRVNSSKPNDTSNDGPFDGSFSLFEDLGEGKIQLDLASFNCVSITDKILLYTLELESIDAGTSDIEIKVDFAETENNGMIIPGGDSCLSTHLEDAGDGVATISQSQNPSTTTTPQPTTTTTATGSPGTSTVPDTPATTTTALPATTTTSIAGGGSSSTTTVAPPPCLERQQLLLQKTPGRAL